MVNKKSQSANAKFASKKAVKKTNANGKEDDPHKDFPRKFRHILQLKQAAAAVGEVREGGGAAAAAAAVKPSSKTNKDKNHKNHHQQVKQSSKFSFAKNGKQVAHLQTGQQKRQQLHGASTSTTTSKKSSKSSSSPSSHHNSNLTSHHTDDNVRVYEKIPFGVQAQEPPKLTTRPKARKEYIPKKANVEGSSNSFLTTPSSASLVDGTSSSINPGRKRKLKTLSAADRMRVLEERERMIETYRGLVKKRKLAAASANNNNPSAEKELFRREADPFSIPGFSHAAGSGRMDEEEED